MDNFANLLSQPRKTGRNEAARPLPQTLNLLASLYRFCGQSMRFPEPVWFNGNYLACLFSLLDHLGAVHEKTAIEAAFASSSAESALEEIQIEYTRLFINGVPHVSAPPYGSAYLDGSLQGKSTDIVLNFYRQHGYQPQDSNIPPGHLVHQLEFLARLTERGDVITEQSFLSTCIIPWYGQFAERVLNKAHHPFYRTVVQIIAFFIEEEDEHGIHGFSA